MIKFILIIIDGFGLRESTYGNAYALANTPELSRALITHRFPLDGAAEAFDVARTRSEGAIKVALDV